MMVVDSVSLYTGRNFLTGNFQKQTKKGSNRHVLFPFSTQSASHFSSDLLSHLRNSFASAFLRSVENADFRANDRHINPRCLCALLPCRRIRKRTPDPITPFFLGTFNRSSLCARPSRRLLAFRTGGEPLLKPTDLHRNLLCGLRNDRWDCGIRVDSDSLQLITYRRHAPPPRRVLSSFLPAPASSPHALQGSVSHPEPARTLQGFRSPRKLQNLRD